MKTDGWKGRDGRRLGDLCSVAKRASQLSNAALGGGRYAMLCSMVGLRHGIEVRSWPRSKFYGNQLQSAPQPGHGVENAP
jgi:hypothetical protein